MTAPSRFTLFVVCGLFVWTFLASRLSWDGPSGLGPRIHYGHFSVLGWRAPTVSGGDEVHYLVTLFSLLEDGDLDVTDDYRAANLGGLHQGIHHRGIVWDHHAFWVNKPTCQLERWWDVYDYRRFLGTCEGSRCTPFARKKAFPPTAIERPLHPAGWPLLLAAVLGGFRPFQDEIEPRASLVVFLLSWATFILIYLIGRNEGWSPLEALLPTLLIAAASPSLVYVKSFFAEPALGFFVITGLYLLRRDLPAFSGIAIGLAVCIKPNFGLVGAAWICILAAQRRWQPALRLTATLGLVVAVGYLAFTKWLLCRWILPMPEGTFWPLTMRMVAVSLWEDEHGLLVFVPWIVPAIVLAFAGCVSCRGSRNLLANLLLPVVVSVPLFFGGGGAQPGSCYGPRYFLPFLHLLALAVVTSVRAFPPRPKKSAIALLVFSGLVGAAIAVPDTLTHDRAAFEQLPVVLRWTQTQSQ